MSKHELEQWKNEELEQILRMDALELDTEYDEEDLWIIMEILAERRRKNPEDKFPGVEQSWKTFQESIRHSNRMAAPLKKKTRRKSWMKYLAGIAAMFVLCCGVSSIHASSYNMWKEIAQWTEHTFSFTNPQQRNTAGASAEEITRCFINDYSSLQEALQHYDVKETLVPQWIPERFRLALIEVDEVNEDVYMEAQYIYQDQLLVVSIHHIVTGRENTLMKNDMPISTVTIDGIRHYIMSYEETNTVTWMNGQNECVIAGNASREELNQMLASIYQ
ncbi:MAG: DUF4367 domain-containing protein [Clostridia bacterium]|nr:DUF4367 domain-containing protein [Clostridia bacterium]